MATHSSILAWRIPGMGEPGGLPSMGSHRVGHDWSDLAAGAAGIKYIFFLTLKKKNWWYSSYCRTSQGDSTKGGRISRSMSDSVERTTFMKHLNKRLWLWGSCPSSDTLPLTLCNKYNQQRPWLIDTSAKMAKNNFEELLLNIPSMEKQLSGCYG